VVSALPGQSLTERQLDVEFSLSEVDELDADTAMYP
jgi:hypothetical protein